MMQLISCDGRKLENRNVSSFYSASSSSSTQSNNNNKFHSLLLSLDDLKKECKLLSKVLMTTMMTRDNNNNNNTFNDNNNNDDDKKNVAVMIIDLRGLSCATISALSAFSIWIKEHISDCFRKYKEETKEKNRSNLLKGQEENPFLALHTSNNNNNTITTNQNQDAALLHLQQQIIDANNNNTTINENTRNNQNQQQHQLLLQLQENHQWEPVLCPRIPQRVSFDLLSCFPSDSHKATRQYLTWLVSTFSWDEIAQLHLFSIFIGCDRLSKTIANLIALHVRQVSMGLKDKMIMTSPKVFFADESSDHDAASNFLRLLFPVVTGSAAKENPELLIEDVQKKKKEMLVGSEANNNQNHQQGAAAAAAAVASASPQKKVAPATQPQQSEGKSKNVVVSERELFETVKFLRNELQY